MFTNFKAEISRMIHFQFSFETKTYRQFQYQTGVNKEVL